MEVIFEFEVWCLRLSAGSRHSWLAEVLQAAVEHNGQTRCRVLYQIRIASPTMHMFIPYLSVLLPYRASIQRRGTEDAKGNLALHSNSQTSSQAEKIFEIRRITAETRRIAGIPVRQSLRSFASLRLNPTLFFGCSHAALRTLCLCVARIATNCQVAGYTQFTQVLLALLCCVSNQSFAATAKANFVFILTDDQRFDAMGCAGNRIIQTPNIDRLAQNGVLFRKHFVTTSICCVSRASIFTGQYERRHGVGDFATPLTPAQWKRTYPALLRAAGYRTGFIGKFGVGDAKSIASKAGDFDFWRGKPGQAGEWFIDPKDPTQTHATARFGNDALDFLDGCSTTQPFCLSISFNAPHSRDGKPREFQPDPRDESLYATIQIPVPKTAADEFFQRLPEFARKSEGRRRWEKRFATPEMFQQTMRDYYRLISGIDREVGRIVAKLAERGLAENTVVIFTSDNGWFAGERGMADKWLMYEESIRVPLVIYDPRLPRSQRGRKVDSMTLNLDFAPTLLGMAGVPVPNGMQGRSLEPLLRGKTSSNWRKDFFYEHHYDPKIIPPSEGIRTERWVYLRWLPPNPESEELYDIRADPLERKNLAANPAYAQTLSSLNAQWQRAKADLK